MKSMLSIGLLTTALAAALLPALRAADETPPPAAGDRNPAPPPHGWRRGAMRDRLRHLSETLNLTPEQKDQIAAIFKDHAPQIQGLRDDEARSREDQRARMQELRQDLRTKIRAILTPEQQTKFDALPRRGRGTSGPGAGQEPPPGDKPSPTDSTAAGGQA